VSPTKLEKKKQQRISHAIYDDLHWFRRGRECLECGHLFLTAELSEAFIQELVDLRDAWLQDIRASARKARRCCETQSRVETVSREDAQTFVRECAYWDHPTSHSYVHAAKHANRVYKHSLGWAVDFGANTFLAGMAISRGNGEIARIFQELEEGKIVFRQDAIIRLQQVISGCVATRDGQEYNGCYPRDGTFLRFGTQLIDTHGGALLILETADSDGLLMGRPSLNN
jgi:hypothetical protein